MSHQHFQLGEGTFAVPYAMHAENRAKLVERMRAAGHSQGIILLQGGEQQYRYDTDAEVLFRQESYFNYLFGAMEPDLYGAIDLGSGRSILFIPQLHPNYAVWQGEIKPPSFFKEKYGTEQVLFVDDISSVLASAAAGAQTIFVLQGVNSDSGSQPKLVHFEGVNAVAERFDTTSLFPVLAECRVHKSDKEQTLLRYVARTSSLAHVDVMRNVRPGMFEFQLESLFLHHTYFHGGCRYQAYTCICGCGPNGAVLHYGHAAAPNSRQINDGDMALLDMGAEYHCYCSDITCSFPVNGKFTANQRFIYEGVLQAQRAVLEAVKPGVSWPDMHRLATRVCLQALIGAGILEGSLDEIIDAKLGPVFMPHGLGHLLGGDTHDVGGYLPHCPPRCMEDGPSFGICKLRTARVLEPGMYLTVEPGIYFMDTMLDAALADPTKAKFINKERLAEFRGFGGVRLEDDVLVTNDGCSNFTLCPRTVEEVESVMAGGPWPPKEDKAPWMKRAWNAPL